MKTLVLVLLLMISLTTQAMCEHEETLYANSITLYIKTQELHETSKKLFKQKKISVEDMAKSFIRVHRSLDAVRRSQHLYYECQTRTIV